MTSKDTVMTVNYEHKNQLQRIFFQKTKLLHMSIMSIKSGRKAEINYREFFFSKQSYYTYVNFILN